MYCPNCGKQISIQSNYCTYCGTNVSYIEDKEKNPQQNVNFQEQKNTIRESEITCLTAIIDFFSVKCDLFKEYYSIWCNLKKYSQKAKSSLLVWGCIITTIFVAILFPEFNGGDKELIQFSAMSVIIGQGMIIGGILMIINNKKKFIFYNNRYNKILKEIHNYYQSYPNCPIGIEYCDPEVLKSILYVIKSGRADTIKEAINIIENDEINKEIIFVLSNLANFHNEI